MQWLFVIRRARQVLTVESILGKPRRPEIELSALNQSGLAAKEFIEAGGTRVEFALDSPFIELRAAEPREMSNLEVSQRLTPQRAAEPQEGVVIFSHIVRDEGGIGADGRQYGQNR